MDRTFQLVEKNDLMGRTLSVTIPEEDLDVKAIKTLRTDLPVFCVPFQYKIINGNVELTYQLGTLNKLSHFLGNKSTDGYISMWQDIISPLILCSDWFLRHNCFLLDSNYIYYHNSQGPHAVRYIYIPTRHECEDASTLKSLVETLSQRNTTDDNALVLQVMRSIQNFNAFEFIQMLKNYQTAKTPVYAATENRNFNQPQRTEPAQSTFTPPHTSNHAQPQSIKNTVTPGGATPNQPSTSTNKPDDEIIIQTLKAGKPEKVKKPKEEKQPKPPKDGSGLLGGIFGKKKPDENKVIGGAAAGMAGSKLIDNFNHTPPQTPPRYIDDDEDNGGVTVVIQKGNVSHESPTLKFVGRGNFPKAIPLKISVGQTFSIGRFDSTVGVTQNDFEFEGMSPEISRRHAVIERKQSCYEITDLQSKGGTFINDSRLASGDTCILNPNDRISFGNAGACYQFNMSN